jgi:hypothetical protein
LLTQILMAATYPLEVVQAARWAEEQNKKKLKPEQIQAEAEKQPWDPSVKSLTAFPQVLDMMNNKLDWTQKLGDAVLAQQPDVLASVQRLRREADAAGNLKSSEQIKVVKESQTIYIEPASPQVIYVPQYNPTVIYGAWPYPAYPPVYYPPPPAYYYPGYNPYATAFAFGVGIAITAAVWNNNWNNHCDYNGGNINIDNSNNINVGGGGRGDGGRPSGGGKWEHNPQHRGGVAYRDQGSRQKYGGQRGSSASTNDYRGRDNISGANRPSSMDRSGSSGGVNRAGTQDRVADRGGDRAGSRDFSGQPSRANAYDGVGSGQREMDRGRASSMQTQRSGGGSMGGGGRSMGGGGGRSMGGGGRGRR